ncbi:hypothetical protein Tfu_0219 [Thermobifida fusca YX]|uniref:Uncharacterized protein n=1 Tax=Thermobifida fusca (strain YX) TaxID=269800 RepID=Q47TF7_THEFY|nr:hypothetical protein Tfu_0219 [Thermobifida fusca YX]MBO2529873.1 hypothetical protein [Thermobifida sp.]PZN61623.1 MAG: hypothetical protein DIU53_12610 [Thermobifida fusca]
MRTAPPAHAQPASGSCSLRAQEESTVCRVSRFFPAAGEPGKPARQATAAAGVPERAERARSVLSQRGLGAEADAAQSAPQRRSDEAGGAGTVFRGAHEPWSAPDDRAEARGRSAGLLSSAWRESMRGGLQLCRMAPELPLPRGVLLWRLVDAGRAQPPAQ